MVGAVGSTSRSGLRPLNAGGGSRDAGLKLLASFPDLERLGAGRVLQAVPDRTEDSPGSKPRIGWGSIAILAVVAMATCTAAWWIDRGPIDPGAAEIARVRLAERGPESAASPVRPRMKIHKTTRR